MPTTVLSLADSAVGGKTAVNLAGLKNPLGAFHHPVGVYGAIEALTSLPARQRVAGLAEVVKSAVIADASLFELLERRGAEFADPRAELWPAVLRRCCAIKAEVVAADPRESGRRAVLNFGHTVGHALESVTRPRLHHGEAVALGMVAAAWISEREGVAPAGTRRRLESLLADLRLPRRVDALDVTAVLAAMRHDKKGRQGRPRMVLTAGIGSSTFGHAVDGRTLRRAVSLLDQPDTA
jgi:3-dehydroquinate synthase